MKLSQIKPNPSNPRIIRDDKFNKLVKSIQQFPAMMEKRPIVVDETMTVLGGNMRLRALQHIYGKSGDIPDNWVTVAEGWTDEQKREFVIKDNAAFGEWDWDALANEWNADDLTDWGIDIPVPEDATEIPTGEVKEDGFDPEQTVETVCKKGDIWKLGDHRLMCGDSTDSGSVALLMDGERADMCFTDPPYALFGNSTGVQGVGDDRMIMPFFRDINNAIKTNTKLMSHAYVCHDWQTSATIKEAFSDLVPKNLIVWKKADKGGLGSFYTKIYELIWLFANEYKKNIVKNNKAKARVINGTPNIWECTIVHSTKRDHNAQKPVKIVATAISNSSDEGESVLDLFGGSGTTMIAAEQLNRRCYMMELDPHYCDIIIARWEKFTGRKAEKITDGMDV